MSSKRDNFDKAIREQIAGAQIEPSPQLWARIESSMASAPIAPVVPVVPIWRRVAVWSSAMAASIAVVVALNVWFSSRSAIEQREYIEEMIAQVEEPTTEPILEVATPIEEIQIAQVVERTLETSTPEILPLVVEESTIEQTHITQPSQRTTKRRSRAESAEQSAVVESPRSAMSIVSNEDQIAMVSPTKRRVDLSLLFAEGPSLGGSTTTSMPRNFAVPNSADGVEPLLTPHSYMSSEMSHRQPISFALNVAMPLSDRVSIESGLNYTLLHSDVDVAYTSNIADQKLSYIGLPLRISYKLFESHNFALYASAGGMVERTLSASVGGQRVDEHNFQFSTGGAIGVQYSINKWIGLYCEPDLSYYLTRTRLMSIRNESPLQFTARAGIRFSL